MSDLAVSDDDDYKYVPATRPGALVKGISSEELIIPSEL